MLPHFRPQPVAASLTLSLGLGLLAACSEPAGTGPNQVPTATIAAPASNLTYRGGDSVAYAGSAADHEDGVEPGSRLTWWVELHHDTHTHPFVPRTTGLGGKFFVPPIGETSDNVFLRLYLEAVDAGGAADTVSRDIQPQKSQFTLMTVPAGLTVTVDGQPQATPLTITGVVGMERELGAPSPQASGGTQYYFGSWSDGGDMIHRIITPGSATTYTATFSTVPNDPPTVSLTSPSPGGSATVNTAVALAATASDADGTVAKVGFYDGTVRLGEDDAAPYTWSWTPGTTGVHSLTARATDDRGASTTSAVVTFTVNSAGNQAPTAQLTAPANGSFLINGVATMLTAAASDPDGSVSRVQFYDGSAMLGEDGTSPYSLPWTPSTNGPHALSVRAIDNLGAVGTSAGVNVTVAPPGTDIQPPTLTLTSPAAQSTNLSGNITLKVTASDNVGVTAVEYQVDADAAGQVTAAPWSLGLGTSAWTTGVHVIRARARDAAGNVSSWSAARVTFGNNVDLPDGFTRSVYVNALTEQGRRYR